MVFGDEQPCQSFYKKPKRVSQAELLLLFFIFLSKRDLGLNWTEHHWHNEHVNQEGRSQLLPYWSGTNLLWYLNSNETCIRISQMCYKVKIIFLNSLNASFRRRFYIHFFIFGKIQLMDGKLQIRKKNSWVLAIPGITYAIHLSLHVFLESCCCCCWGGCLPPFLSSLLQLLLSLPVSPPSSVPSHMASRPFSLLAFCPWGATAAAVAEVVSLPSPLAPFLCLSRSLLWPLLWLTHFPVPCTVDQKQHPYQDR